MLNDTILIWKFNRGSADALRAIYQKYRTAMLTVATALCNDVHTAEDIVQDCFITFARSGRRLKIRGSLRGYLITSVVNRVRDHQRAGHRRPRALAETDTLPDPQDGPETAAIGQEQTRRLCAALTELPGELREVVILYTRGQMTYGQIANVQKVSIPTVQRRYRSGLNQLRVLLNGEVKP